MSALWTLSVHGDCRVDRDNQYEVCVLRARVREREGEVGEGVRFLRL